MKPISYMWATNDMFKDYTSADVDCAIVKKLIKERIVSKLNGIAIVVNRLKVIIKNQRVMIVVDMCLVSEYN